MSEGILMTILRSDVTNCVEAINGILNENSLRKRLIENYAKEIFELIDKQDKIQKEIELIKKCIFVLQKISDDRNMKSRKDMQELIDSALSSIFPDREYSVVIDEYSHGTRKHMKILLSDGGVTRELKLSHGTGVKQIISFLFNISLLAFKGSSRVMLLDETLASISDNKAIIVSDMLVSLKNKNNFQFLIIDHNDNLWENEEVTVVKLKFDNEKGTHISEIRRGISKSTEDSVDESSCSVIGL